MLRHRPQASNVAVVSSLRNKNGGETLILKNKKKKNKKSYRGRYVLLYSYVV
jgi:hypothetical protein